MQFKALTIAALASKVTAQMMSLTEALNSSTQLSSLNGLLGQYPDVAKSLAGLSNITLLAPNNDAISELLSSSAGMAASADSAMVQAFLTYHVLNGTYANFTDGSTFVPTALQPGPFANVTGGQVVEATVSGENTTIYSGLFTNSSVVGESVNFTGGVVHIIDRALTLPLNVSSTAVALNLTSAVGALGAANLTETVDTTKNLTIFVPNNEAFQSIGSALPGLTPDQIVAMLQYHVVPDVAYSSSLSNTSLTSLEGTNLTITVEDESVFVDGARVVIPDVLVANGVVHVIDNVLNPLNASVTAGPSQTSGVPAFSGASSASDVPFTSNVPTPTISINTASIASAAATAGVGGSGGNGGSGESQSSSSSGGAWMPQPTAMRAVMLGGLGMALAL